MHPRDEDLEMYAMSRLPQGQTSAIQLHVLECELCQNTLQRFALPPGVDRAERRSEVRIPFDGALSIRVLDASAAVLAGRIVNASKKGLKLNLPEALYPGTRVQIRLGSRIIMAQVRYCVPRGAEFHAGVEIIDVFSIPGKPPSSDASDASSEGPGGAGHQPGSEDGPERARLDDS